MSDFGLRSGHFINLCGESNLFELDVTELNCECKLESAGSGCDPTVKDLLVSTKKMSYYVLNNQFTATRSHCSTRPRRLV